MKMLIKLAGKFHFNWHVKLSGKSFLIATDIHKNETQHTCIITNFVTTKVSIKFE